MFVFFTAMYTHVLEKTADYCVNTMETQYSQML